MSKRFTQIDIHLKIAFTSLISKYDFYFNNQIKYVLDKSSVSKLALIDNQTLISGYLNGNLKIWNLKNGDLINQIDYHQFRILKIIVEKQKGLLITADSDGLIVIWNLKTFEPKVFIKERFIYTLILTNNFIVTANNYYQVNGSLVNSLSLVNNPIYLQEDQFVSYSYNDSFITLNDLKNQSFKTINMNLGLINSIIKFRNGILFNDTYQRITFWDLVDPDPKYQFSKTGILDSLLNIDDKHFVYSSDHQISLCDYDSGQILKQIRLEYSSIESIKMLKNNDLLIKARNKTNFSGLYQLLILNFERQQIRQLDQQIRINLALSDNLIATYSNQNLLIWE